MKKITKIKTTYYSKEILKHLLSAGLIYIAASSPYFVLGLMKNLSQPKKPNRNKTKRAFNYLKNKGLIELNQEGHDIRIALTKEGKKRAGKHQINDLEIEKPKKWDKKWRLVVFDIPHRLRIQRNAFRKKLKELGFYSLQKSVWLHPFPCEEEVKLLREFLGLDKNQIQLLVVEKIENDSPLRKSFKL